MFAHRHRSLLPVGQNLYFVFCMFRVQILGWTAPNLRERFRDLVTGWTIRSSVPARQRNFHLPQIIQNVSGTHHAAYSTGTGVSFRRVSDPDANLFSALHLNGVFKYGSSYTSAPLSSWRIEGLYFQFVPGLTPQVAQHCFVQHPYTTRRHINWCIGSIVT